MGNLTAVTGQESQTVAAIYASYKSKGDAESRFSNRLGASAIGHECDRHLWFSFRWCFKPDFEGRLYRLFDTGKIEETRMCADLRNIGCEVLELDPETGKQFELTAVGGHFVNKLDAVCIGLPEAPKSWHTCEFKTMGGTEDQSKDFEAVKKLGLRDGMPKHWAQCVTGMAMSKIDRCLYLCKKKATDELHAERLRYDAGEAKAIMARAERIIRAAMPGERCATRPDDWRCKFCDAQELCWGTGKSAVPLPCKSCRTCCHATPELDGDARWSCAFKDPSDGDINRGTLSFEMQAKACQHHLLIPGLVGFAEVFDAGYDWIMFKNADGRQWVHGSHAGQWTTEELMRVPASVVGVKEVDAAKAIFNGECIGVEPALPLIDRYPPEDCELLWEGARQNIEVGIASLGLENVFTDANGMQVEPTEKQQDDKINALEYANTYLLVIYKADNYAAIWKGKE